MDRRQFSRLALMLAAAPALAVARSPQPFPERAVRIVVPFAPGGATDIVARLLGQRLSEAWGQSVLIENVAGAAGNVGAERVARAAPDGYSLLMASGSVLTANPFLYRQHELDWRRDLAPIAKVAEGPMLLVVHPDLPVRNLAELVAYARSKGPGALNYGSAGIGSQVHLAAEQLLAAVGVQATHIPYRGAGPALTALLGGDQIQFMTDNLASSLPLVQSGRLRALAVTSSERIAQLPDLPTVAESGIAGSGGFDVTGWFALMAPSGTPAPLVEQLHAQVALALDSPRIRGQFFAQGIRGRTQAPRDVAEQIRTESQRMASLIQSRGITL